MIGLWATDTMVFGAGGWLVDSIPEVKLKKVTHTELNQSSFKELEILMEEEQLLKDNY